MVTIQENTNLKPFNTFGINAYAKFFCEISSLNDFQELLQTDTFKKEKQIILGGGSNVLFKSDFDGIVIHNSIKGKEVIGENDDQVLLKVASGELWHDTVMYCVEKNWGGIENLSLIPGTVGAAPIQNIGAYGVEVRQVIASVEFLNLENGAVEMLSVEECKFGYRESVFKREWKEKFFISSVTLTLSKKNHHISTSYGAIIDTLKLMKVDQPSIKNISEAVIKIRSEKLPDFKTLGNAGSFFKNPELSSAQFLKLKNEFPDVPHYSANQGVKVPAGWLIEQCGWKGKRFGNVGVHAMQALVLVNFGDARGEEIFSLAEKIISSVQQKFSITLTPEVNIF